MAKEKINLGILFPDDSIWTGGKNYFLSLITSLKYLKYNELNYVIIASPKSKNLFLKNNINLKNIYFTNFFKSNHILNLIRKIFLFFFRKDIILNFIIKLKKINIFSHYKPHDKIKSVCWIPDVQHKYFKKNFSKKEIQRRDLLFKNYLNHADKVIVSSLDSKKKLISNYKDIKKTKIEILRFVPKVNLKKLKNLDIKKYRLKKKFLYTPNQFWRHKNHQVLIECAKELKKKNYYIQFVLSGDYSINKEYFNYLLKKIKKFNLDHYFNYVGMIPSNDVSKLIFKSKALVNPSFFEGWNTGVEEAKILKKKIILSNIDVHKEQASRNSVFFEKTNPKQLAKVIMNLKDTENKNLIIIKNNYQKSRKEFAKQYLNILKKINLMY